MAKPVFHHSHNVVIAGSAADDDITLLDVLDHILHQGVIIRGNLVISLAGVDLIYAGLDVILTSVETALRHIARTSQPLGRAPSRE